MNKLLFTNITIETTAAINEAAEELGSIWPFVGFMILLAGLIVTFSGIVRFVTSWREFSLFYNASTLDEKPDINVRKRKMIKYGIIIGIGVILIVVSNFF